MSQDTIDNSQPGPAAAAAPKSNPFVSAFAGVGNLLTAMKADRANRRHLAANRRAMHGSNLPATQALTDQDIAEQLQQLSLDSNTPIATIVAMLAGQTQDVQEVIQSFDEDKEHPIGRVIGLVATILAYVLPWLIAFYAGSALGYTYSEHKPFNFLQTQTAFYYLVSWAYEFGLVLLMLAMVRQFKRVSSNRRKGLVMLIALLVLFVVLAVTSACAQWILFETHINTHDGSQVIGAVFRTLGTPLTDLTCAIVLAVLHIRTLDQHLDTLQKKTEATIAINRKKLQNRLEVINAAMEVKNTLQKEEDYRAKNELANTIIGLFSENAIDTIRQSLEGRRNDTGSSYRRDGYR